MTRAHMLLVGITGLVLMTVACRDQDRHGVASPETAAGQQATAQLQELVDSVWAHRLERDVLTRLSEGLPVERLPDVSHREAELTARFYREVEDRLEAIDRSALSHQDALTYDVLAWDAEMTVAGLPYFWHQSTLTPYSSPLSNLRQVFTLLPLATTDDLDAYLGLVDQVPALVDDLRQRVAGQLERGIAVPEPNLAPVLALIRSSIVPAGSGPFAVTDERLAKVGDEERREAFHARHAEIIDQSVNPALERLHALVKNEMPAISSASVGAGALPGGADYYRYLVRYHTTLDISPDEVQAIGREMVADLQAEMGQVQQAVGFVGSRSEFRDHVLADPRFYAETPDEVGTAILRAADAMMNRIDDYFEIVPNAPYGVRRLHPALEASMTYGYYDPPSATEPSGYYNYNGSNLAKRSTLGIVGLSLHELMPGHHFQIARQLENEDLPPLRRYTYPTAYTEGWGSYASYLGLEAGIADDPYDRYGIYTLEVFLANRLVVDPGLNAFGWDLDRARAYMRENTFESDTQIASETLRYSTDMPGQALAYQIGKRKLLELRADAEAALGDRFDLRRFHEAVIGSGPLPLAVLERHIDWFIEQELTR